MENKICRGCKNWNNGEGGGDCLKCAKMLSRVPGVDTGRMRRQCNFQRASDFDKVVEKYREQPAPVVPQEIYEAIVTDPVSGIDRKLDVRKALDSLSTQQRRVVELRLEGASWSDVAQALGISRGAALNHYRRTISKLRKILE